MALKSPMMPSPSGGLTSSFSPWTDSPNSPAPFASHFPPSKRTSDQSDSLAPPASPYPQHVDPSPTDSNGTENTDIDEDAQETEADDVEEQTTSPSVIHSPASPESLAKIDTQLPPMDRTHSDDAPQSVIHVPSGFKQFDVSENALDTSNLVPSPSQRSENTVVSPTTPDAAAGPNDQRLSRPPLIITDESHESPEDRSTPRAKTRQEAEEEERLDSRRSLMLEDIPETLDADKSEIDALSRDHAARASDLNGDFGGLSMVEPELAALNTALSECWTLCNTLAGLSSTHRHRIFSASSRVGVQENAWRSCWRLCQQLYESRDIPSSHVQPTLVLCREFCQALFDARQRGDQASDSVLRVSFELNNHLYNIHDRQLPHAIQERTLDFYVTLCHRLMKQRISLPQESDALLHACWSLAEMLFNLRQTNRESRAADEELLGSAVQACWELCDLFREGWSQVRPERGTPRPSQTTFAQQTRSSVTQSDGRSSSLSARSYHDAPTAPPETPITIFDDTTAASSPESVSVPNILVLGPASSGGGSGRHRGTHHDRWSSNASTMSDYSGTATSQRSSSTATAGADETHLGRLRSLIIKAAMVTGFTRTSGQSLQFYVNSMPAQAFGALPWQCQVLESYKNLVTVDPSLRAANIGPARTLSAKEIAKAVRWLGGDEQWAWMRDLFRLVFGFGIEEAGRKTASIQI